jgi:hypothetical protein
LPTSNSAENSSPPHTRGYTKEVQDILSRIRERYSGKGIILSDLQFTLKQAGFHLSIELSDLKPVRWSFWKNSEQVVGDENLDEPFRYSVYSEEFDLQTPFSVSAMRRMIADSAVDEQGLGKTEDVEEDNNDAGPATDPAGVNGWAGEGAFLGRILDQSNTVWEFVGKAVAAGFIVRAGPKNMEIYWNDRWTNLDAVVPRASEKVSYEKPHPDRKAKTPNETEKAREEGDVNSTKPDQGIPASGGDLGSKRGSEGRGTVGDSHRKVGHRNAGLSGALRAICAFVKGARKKTNPVSDSDSYGGSDWDRGWRAFGSLIGDAALRIVDVAKLTDRRFGKQYASKEKDRIVTDIGGQLRALGLTNQKMRLVGVDSLGRRTELGVVQGLADLQRHVGRLYRMNVLDGLDIRAEPVMPSNLIQVSGLSQAEIRRLWSLGYSVSHAVEFIPGHWAAMIPASAPIKYRDDVERAFHVRTGLKPEPVSIQLAGFRSNRSAILGMACQTRAILGQTIERDRERVNEIVREVARKVEIERERERGPKLTRGPELSR